MRIIAIGDSPSAQRLLDETPALATAHLIGDAGPRQLDPLHAEVENRIRAGATALHLAAAAHSEELVRTLRSLGADARARDRRGAEPIHCAALGQPDSPLWSPNAQAATITLLIEAGADPNAVDKSGVSALHRAVRARCAAAVKALLDGGADPTIENGNGSTPLFLATHLTGRGRTGTSASKHQQDEILLMLAASLGERSQT